MSYQPTLFLTLEVAQRISDFLLPIEVTTQNILKQAGLADSSKKVALHNLGCFTKFREAQQEIVDKCLKSENSSFKIKK